MVGTMEYAWEQIENNKILKENHMTKQSVQTALRPFRKRHKKKEYYTKPQKENYDFETR